MTARRAWLAAWLGGPVIGIVNGAAREKGYAERVGERAAQRISTGAALVLFAGYFGVLEHRWPLRTARTAAEVGAAWTAATVAFEFLFGHYAAGESWEDLLKAYDVRTGNLWILVPLWMAAGPSTVRAVHSAWQS
jgi:hypothetical protein